MATHNEKEIKTKWPFVEGSSFGTTKRAPDAFLLPQEKSLIPKRLMAGIWR